MDVAQVSMVSLFFRVFFDLSLSLSFCLSGHVHFGKCLKGHISLGLLLFKGGFSYLPLTLSLSLYFLGQVLSPPSFTCLKDQKSLS